MGRLVVVVALALLFFFSCSAGQPRMVVDLGASMPWSYDICVDEKFTVDELERVTEAIDEWSDALDGIVVLRMRLADVSSPINMCRVTIHRMTSEDDIFVRHPRSIGVASKIGGRTIWIAIDRLKWRGDPIGLLRGTVAHELGHTFWLDHTVGGLMNRYVIYGSRVSYGDAYLAAYGLGMERSLSLR